MANILSASDIPDHPDEASRTRWLMHGVCAVSCGITAWMGLSASGLEGPLTLLWAPSGLALAATVLLGFWTLLSVFLGISVALAIGGISGGYSLVLAAGTVVCAGLGATALRSMDFSPALRRRSDLVIWLVGGVLIPPIVGGVVKVGGLLLVGAGDLSLRNGFRISWMADVAGVLVVSPLIWSWATRGRAGITLRSATEIGLLCVATLMCVGFGGWWTFAGGQGIAGLVLLPLPFLGWSALRFGQRGASTLVVLLAAMSASGLVSGSLPSSMDHATLEMSLWLVSSVYSIAGLVLCFLNQSQSAALRQLAAEEERLLLATESARVGVWDCDLVTQRVFRSRESMGMLGLEDCEVADTFAGWRARIHPSDVARFDAVWSAHARGEVERYEVDVRLRDVRGQWHWVRDKGLIVKRSPDGTPLRAAGTQTDIHEEKVALLAEGSLQTLARSLAGVTTVDDAAAAMVACVYDLVDAKTVAVWFVDSDGQALRLVGHHEESLPESLALVKVQDAVSRGEAVSLEPLNSEGVGRVDQPIVIEGTWVGFLAVIGLDQHVSDMALKARFASVSAHSAGALMRLRAQRERAELERQILHTQKLDSLGVLAGGVAHDFNNMLATILGNTGFVLQEMPQSEPYREALEDVEVAARRAAELCRSLLNYAGRGSTSREIVPLNDLVRELGSLLDAARKKKANLTFDLSAAPCFVEGDAAQLRQVVLNLVTNASDALGEKGGTVAIRTRVLELTRSDLSRTLVDDALSPGVYVALTVEDDGVGMSADVRERIFDPFYSTKTTGHGLGLASVLGILRGHNGAVRIESSPGNGSRFDVYLPASAEHAIAREPTEESAPPRPGLALVVDDEEKIRVLVARILRAIGWEVEEAEDGLAAVEKFRIRPERFALVVLDMTMPRMGGAEALTLLREARPEIPVLLSSGYADQVDNAAVAGVSGTRFLAKPWTPTQFKKELAKLLSLGSG